jgi:hypothetical protein
MFEGCFEPFKGAGGLGVEDLSQAETAAAAGDLLSVLVHSESIASGTFVCLRAVGIYDQGE